MKTIIMAGGRGTRISEIYSDIPKPMIPIDGVPVLEREICSLRNQGFTDIIITVSHLGNIIMNYFGNGSGISPVTGERFGVNISYFNEQVPLGNAGALFQLRDVIGDEPFLLLNGDVVFDVDFKRMVDFHMRHCEKDGWGNNKTGILVSLFTHPNNHPYDSGVLITDKNGAVAKWLTKEDEKPEFYKNRVNAGLHVIDPVILDMAAHSEGPYEIAIDKIGMVKQNTGELVKADLDRQLLRPLQGTGHMFCYDSPEYVKDMGTPERLNEVISDFKIGRVNARNLANKQKAVFLDRDGTINVYKGFLKDIDKFELIHGVAEAVKEINASGYLAIVITNQPVVARGEVSFRELEQIHNKMETLLGLEGAYIDAIYYCPHHPHKGYEGEVLELKIDCECRKPKPGMLLKAAEDFNIDLSESFMLGDSENDVKCGLAAGCKSILVGGNGKYGQIDTVESIAQFTKKYLKISTKLIDSDVNYSK